MYQVVLLSREQELVEIGIDGELTKARMTTILDEMRALCAVYAKVSVLIDLRNMTRCDVRAVLAKYSFCRSYGQGIHRVAIVSDRGMAALIAKLAGAIIDAEVRSFSAGDIEIARSWVFPRERSIQELRSSMREDAAPITVAAASRARLSYPRSRTT